MEISDDSQQKSTQPCWTEVDPALRKALEQLKCAQSYYEGQVALNIIKVIVEHEIEERIELTSHSEQRQKHSWPQNQENRHWYDLQETLNSASSLLSETPSDLHRQVLPSVAHMIEHSIRKPFTESP